LLATTCTTFASIPQILSIWKTKSARDISIHTYAILSVGIVLWIVYGFMWKDAVFVLANMVSLCLCGTMIALKVKFDLEGCYKALGIKSQVEAEGTHDRVDR
jgi:MtN3 and saliva related transmembrane protein